MRNQVNTRGNSKLKLYQFELPCGKRRAPKPAYQQRPKPVLKGRIHSAISYEDNEDGYINRPNTRVSLYAISQSPSSSPLRCSPSPCVSLHESHDCVSLEQDCVSMEQDKTPSQSSQRILVGSALRRPHATQFSPLDYQSMPDAGKSPRQPYKSNSACTVFTYANRPLSAAESPKHLGKHTRSSLLRSKSASSGSLDSVSSYSSCTSSVAGENKRLCVVREDYRFFKSRPNPKQVPPHGQTMHAFLTGARYNSVRYLDCRTLAKLGVYIPKDGLNTFFVRDEAAPVLSDESTDTDNEIDMAICKLENTTTEVTNTEKEKVPSTEKAVNTEPHYLSINRWHSAEWKSERCKPNLGTRAKTAPLNRYKAIKAYYYDYDKKHKQRKT